VRMGEGRVDLHVHTTASDGTQTPREVVEEALRKGLKAIAITDHDSIDGLEEAMEAGRRLGVEVIPGVEINAQYEGKEAHVLGYFVELGDTPLSRTLERLRLGRLERIRKIVSKLNGLGVGITFEDVLSFAEKGGALGRPHVARAIAARGYAKDPSEAFSKYLDKDKPAYVPRPKLTPHEAVRVIVEAGAVPVLAHPAIAGHWEELICELMALGLRGIEAYHPDHSPEEAERYRGLAERLGLIITGGSDAHGPGAVRAIEVGAVTMPYSVVSRLKGARDEIRCLRGLSCSAP